MISLKSLLESSSEWYVYHIARKSDLPSIKSIGIQPNQPSPDDPKAVYVFPSRDAAEDALMNWLGDKFEENESLVMLTINRFGLKLEPSEAGYELLSYTPIPFEKVAKVEDI